MRRGPGLREGAAGGEDQREKESDLLHMQSLEREVNARAEAESAEIDRLEINKVGIQVGVLPGVTRFERQDETAQT